MVSIKFSGMCNGCRHAELELQAFESPSYDNFSFETDKLWTIHCTHERVCEEWNKEVKELTDEVKTYRPTE